MSIDRAYGCLFCVTGKEMLLAERIRQVHPEVRVLVAQREKVQKQGGDRVTSKDLLLPGYVFFEADAAFSPFESFRMSGVFRVLRKDEEEWRLQGSDLEFAKWLFRRNGLLETSVAYREDDKIRIVEGPLKDLEGRISRLDRHSRRGRVELDFGGRIFSVWLTFDIVERSGEDSKEEPGNRKDG